MSRPLCCPPAARRCWLVLLVLPLLAIGCGGSEPAGEPVAAATAQTEEVPIAADELEPTAVAMPTLEAGSELSLDLPALDASPAADAATGPSLDVVLDAPVDPEPVTDAEPSDGVDPKLYGTWKLDYHGVWKNTLQPGGTGSTSVVFDYAASWLYGNTIDFKLQWEFTDGQLIQTLVSGTPKANYDALVRDHGKTRVYEIVEIGDETMTLKTVKDGLVSKWTRLE